MLYVTGVLLLNLGLIGSSCEVVSASSTSGLLDLNTSMKVVLEAVDKLLLILSDLAVGRCCSKRKAVSERTIINVRNPKNSEVLNLACSDAFWIYEVPFSKVIHTGFPLTPCANAAIEGTKPLMPSPIK